MARLHDGYLCGIELNPFIEIDRHRFPFTLPVFHDFERLELHPRCTFFVGENGSGKSTLLEAIAVKWGFAGEGGSTKHARPATFDSVSKFDESLRPIRGIIRPGDDFFLRAESLYTFATWFQDTGEARFRDMHFMSHGESFLAALNAWLGAGLYLMDEPESALSPMRQLALLTRMNDLIIDESQFIVATHSPILLAYPDCWIYELSPEGIKRVTYEETEHYQVTRSFLQAPERFLRHLM